MEHSQDQYYLDPMNRNKTSTSLEKEKDMTATQNFFDNPNANNSASNAGWGQV